jgi:hypothetical protein
MQQPSRAVCARALRQQNRWCGTQTAEQGLT